MSLNQASNAFDHLGQTAIPAALVRLPTGVEPKLQIAWGSFHRGIGSSLAVLFKPSSVPRDFLTGGFFKDSWVERRIPRRALVAAALWHYVFLVMPSPQVPAAPTHYSAFDNTELTWSGPINDLPLLEIKTPKAKPSPRGEPETPLPSQGAAAFHPRQRIFTDPVRPTHPRQTLINSAAPMEPPKILPDLPNIVQIQQLPGPARPRLQISQETLTKLRPRERRAAVTAAPLPDVAPFEQKSGEIPLPVSPGAPTRPKLELNAGAAPRVAPRAESDDAGPAPEVGTAESSTRVGNPATFIALSATPAPPAPVVPLPQGNLSARVSISPEGKNPGVPGGSQNRVLGANGGAGGGTRSNGGTGNGSGVTKNGLDVSISGGIAPANNVVSGLGDSPKISVPAQHKLMTKPDPRTTVDDPPGRTGPPNFAALPPNAQPEQVFASKKIYKLLVNMPNLNSATGSWILNFSELRLNTDGPRMTSPDISDPVPVRKVDPKYPPVLINERVEGEVVLYAVIRSDGSVDSIQLIRGIDEQLDANAMDALSQWKFRPAAKQGTPVDLEAIVHIPFHPLSNR
jgi:TonB family protein